MTTFPDLSAYEDETTDEHLVLPINGREYRFSPSIPMSRGIWITRVREESRRYGDAIRDARAKLTKQLDRDPTSDELRRHLDTHGPKPRSDLDMTDAQELDLYLDLIGDEQRAAMEADGVTWQQLIQVGSTLFAWYIAGRDAALRVWTRGKIEDGDVNPPAEPSAPSGQPRTSPSSSTKTKRANSNSSKTRSRGATTSSAGASSRRISNASTA